MQMWLLGSSYKIMQYILKGTNSLPTKPSVKLQLVNMYFSPSNFLSYVFNCYVQICKCYPYWGEYIYIV